MPSTSANSAAVVVAVGTTSDAHATLGVRACGELRAHQDETDIFITPVTSFRWLTCCLTNFHLPKSTLMMLVSAFAGFDHIRALYAHAIAGAIAFQLRGCDVARPASL